MIKLRRLMDNDYLLVNQSDTSQSIVIHRRMPKDGGIYKIPVKDELKERSFTIVDAKGLARFQGATELILKNRKREHPFFTDSDNNIWKIEELPTVAAATPATDGNTKRKGRPPGSKNKSKKDAKPLAEVAALPVGATMAGATADEAVADAPIAEADATPADAAAITPVAEVAEPVNESASIMADGSTPAA